MNNILINKIFNVFNSSIALTETEQIKLRYILEVLINEFIKLIAMFIFFTSFGYGLAFIFCFITLMIIRPMTGGFHMKGFWSCFIFSFVFFVSCILLARYVSLIYFLQLMLFTFSMLVYGFFAPIVPKQRPKYPPDKMLRSKIISLTVVILYFLLFNLYGGSFLRYGIWVLVLQAVQLLISLGGTYYEIKQKTN